MKQQKHYQVLLTEEQAEQLRYVCEDMSEPYSDMACAEEEGGSPFVDRPDANFLTNVSETLDFVHMMIEEPVYEGEAALVAIDADQKIHLLNVLSEYHGFLVDYISDKLGDDELRKQVPDDLYTMYLLGNIEGRLLYGGLTDGDLKLLQAWDEFLEGCKEEEFPSDADIEKVMLLDLDKMYTCPDCGAEVQGYELQVQDNDEIPYVCPACGCIQEVTEVEAQLGFIDDKEE